MSVSHSYLRSTTSTRSMSIGSSSGARELLTRMDTGHICRLSLEAGFCSSVPALQLLDQSDEIRPGFFRNLTIALFCGLSYLSINIREGENHAGNTASAYWGFDSVAGIDQPFYCSNSYWARWCRGRAT